MKERFELGFEIETEFGLELKLELELELEFGFGFGFIWIGLEQMSDLRIFVSFGLHVS